MKVLTPIVLQELYREPGEYSAKFMLDPKRSQSIEDVRVTVRNSDGNDICKNFKRWGTKLTLSFVIDDRTPDGVVIVETRMKLSGKELCERFSCWVVK